jgi:hypothetical protein
MTLAQIRSLLKTNPPPLSPMLEMQLQACRARKDEAVKALELVHTALATISSGRQLALNELCNLTWRMKVGNHHVSRWRRMTVSGTSSARHRRLRRGITRSNKWSTKPRSSYCADGQQDTFQRRNPGNRLSQVEAETP